MRIAILLLLVALTILPAVLGAFNEGKYSPTGYYSYTVLYRIARNIIAPNDIQFTKQQPMVGEQALAGIVLKF